MERALAQVLVFGWLAHPQAGLSQLVRVANSVGIVTSKQTLDAHFTQRTAAFLLALLQEAVRRVVSGPQVALPLLQRFRGVYLEDGSTISLPSVLADIWRGSGGNPEGKQGPGQPTPAKRRQDPRTEAAVKLVLRWDLLGGQLRGPHLQAGRQHDLHSVLREDHLPKGSLWIGDLGYFALIWLSHLAKQGVFFLIRYKEESVLWIKNRRIDDLLELLPTPESATLELDVQVGASKQLQARLLVMRVPEAVARQRQDRLQETARRKLQTCSARRLALCHWSLMLTNVPASQLCLSEALALLRARWQIEMLWKLWKEQGHLDTWSSQKPWQVLCELYAKILAMIVQHWLLLQGCWDDPHHSLGQAAGVVRERSAVLLSALRGQAALLPVVRDTVKGIRLACPIPARPQRPSTSRLLLGLPFWDLT